jgi:hypothetical protein
MHELLETAERIGRKDAYIGLMDSPLMSKQAKYELTLAWEALGCGEREMERSVAA